MAGGATAGSDRFASAAMAEGYARSRPPVHPLVVERARAAIGRAAGPLGSALDVGCGAGLSTRPLLGLAERVVGVDPARAMVAAARALVPGATFAVGAAEHLPVRDASIDLIAAAGSLDFADYPAFAAEAVRVLRPDGVVVVYDFSAGRRLADGQRPARGDALGRWYEAFRSRWPAPRPHLDLRPILAAGPHLTVRSCEPFTVPVTLTRAAYLAYVMTDAPDPTEAELAEWCRATLPDCYGEVEDVAFDGYLAVLTAG